MAQFVLIPPASLESDTLQAMLEEFVSRDGTDYGLRELTLEEKVENLRQQILRGELELVYDLASEQWDLVDSDRLEELNL